MKFNLCQDKGSFLITFTIRGKQNRFYPGTKDEKIARQIQEQMLYEWSQGKFDSTLESYKLSSKSSFNNTLNLRLVEVWDLWVKSLQLSKATQNNHYHTIRQIILKHNPKWSSLSWFLGYRDIWSAYTFNSRKGFLKNCINWAIKEGKIEGSNPYESIKPKKQKKVDHVKPFNKSEISLILKAFESSYPHYLNFVKFQFLTGCRPGEAIALTWKDVDFENHTIYIGKALSKDYASNPYASRKVLKETKTGAVGFIPLNGALLETMQAQRKLVMNKALQYVFPGLKGDYLSTSSFRDIWKKVLSTVGIEYRYPYQCRHTALSKVAAEKGLLAASKLARHSNSVMVAKHYARFTDEISLPDLI